MFGKGLGKGLGVTLKRMLQPNITEYYPEQKPNLPPRVRSSMENDPDKCISCRLCIQACPNEVIELTSEMDENKKKKLTSYTMDFGRCLYCGMCVEVCPSNSLINIPRFETATYERGDLFMDMIADYRERHPKAETPATEVAKPATKAEGKEE